MQKIPNLARTAGTHELPAHVETTRVNLRLAGLVRVWMTGSLYLALLVLINKSHAVAGIPSNPRADVFLMARIQNVGCRLREGSSYTGENRENVNNDTEMKYVLPIN